jgi:hypothetical protein
MKMNPLNIPIHEAGHVVVCQELGILMTRAVVDANGGYTDFERNIGPLDKRLCAFVAGTIAEHLFGVEDGRFLRISAQLGNQDYREFEANGSDDLAEAKHYAEVLTQGELEEQRNCIREAEDRAECLLNRNSKAVCAIAQGLWLSGEVMDSQAKDLIASNRDSRGEPD